MTICFNKEGNQTVASEVHRWAKKTKTHQNWPQFRRHLEQRHWHWPKRQTWAATFNMVNDRLWMYSIYTHQYIDRRRGDLRLNIAEVQARVYLDNYCGLKQNQYTYSTSYRAQYRGVVMAQTLGMFHIVPIINLGINSFFWKTACYVPDRLLLGLWRIRLISLNLDLWSRICSWFSSLPVNEWDDAGIRNLVEWRNIHPIPLPLPPWVFSYKFPQLARYQRGEQSPQRIDAPAIVSGSFRMVQWYCSFHPDDANAVGSVVILSCIAWTHFAKIKRMKLPSPDAWGLATLCQTISLGSGAGDTCIPMPRTGSCSWKVFHLGGSKLECDMDVQGLGRSII